MQTDTLEIVKPKKVKKKKVSKIRKRLVLGDIHGHLDTTLNIIENECPDDVIILGDYFDNFHGTDKEIIDCFKTLIDCKVKHEKSGKGQFIMLIGNHDFQYIDLGEHYSGKRKSYELTVSMMLDRAIENKQLQYFFIDDINKTVYSHAGIMNKWLSENRLFINDLHDLENIDPSKFKFTHRGGNSGYGDGPYASPIWVRPYTLMFDMYKDNSGWEWTQIVGHTQKSIPSIYCGSGMDIFTGEHNYEYEQDDEGLFWQYTTKEWPHLYVIDSLPYYYIIEEINNENGKIIKRNVKKNDLVPSKQEMIDKRIKDLYNLLLKDYES